MFGAYQRNDGFVVAFENGWAVSVRFGRQSFSSTQYEDQCDDETQMCTSADAELAILFKGKISGDVFSSVSTEAYAAICGYIAGVPSLQDPEEVHAEAQRLTKSRAGWQKSPERNP